MSTESRPQLTQEISSLDKVIELVPGTKAAESATNAGPDIDWDPVFSKHLARMKALAKLNLPRETSVPEGFPTVVDAPWVWDGADLKESDYILQLSEADIKEINNALAFFKGQSFFITPLVLKFMLTSAQQAKVPRLTTLHLELSLFQASRLVFVLSLVAFTMAVASLSFVVLIPSNILQRTMF
jgi:hypothetical protein